MLFDAKLYRSRPNHSIVRTSPFGTSYSVSIDILLILHSSLDTLVEDKEQRTRIHPVQDVKAFHSIIWDIISFHKLIIIVFHIF